MSTSPSSRSPYSHVLSDLTADSGALTVLLVTRQGIVLASSGDTTYLNTTAMAALVAGMFSATREVARMVGEDQFSILLQQGEKRHIHISLIGEETMMVIVFEDQNRIGMIRLNARRAADKLVRELSSATERAQASDDLALPQFREYALNLIDRIFES